MMSSVAACCSIWSLSLELDFEIMNRFVDVIFVFFFSSRRRHTRYWRDWSSDVCSSDLSLARSQSVREPASNDRLIAFQDISVIPMDTERVLPHQTVLVRSGKITDVGPTSSVHLPPGTVVIDGRDKFLLPGMADMHTHVDRKEMLPLVLGAE